MGRADIAPLMVDGSCSCCGRAASTAATCEVCSASTTWCVCGQILRCGCGKQWSCGCISRESDPPRISTIESYKGYTFRRDPYLGSTALGDEEAAFFRYVVDHAELGFGRMRQIIQRVWDQEIASQPAGSPKR